MFNIVNFTNALMVFEAHAKEPEKYHGIDVLHKLLSECPNKEMLESAVRTFFGGYEIGGGNGGQDIFFPDELHPLEETGEFHVLYPAYIRGKTPEGNNTATRIKRLYCEKDNRWYADLDRTDGQKYSVYLGRYSTGMGSSMKEINQHG